MTPFTEIDGLSDERRLSRRGKIHLGIKVSGGKSEYPKATDYFVFEKNETGNECRAKYGEKPRELIVLIPSPERTETFPQSYKLYGSGKGVICTGNGVRAERKEYEGAGKDAKYTGKVSRDCAGKGHADQGIEPCPDFASKKCKCMGNLLIILPKVDPWSVFQIDTSSINSIIDINSGIDNIAELARKNKVAVTMIPSSLRIVPRQASVQGKRTTIFSMILSPARLTEMAELRADMEEIMGILAGSQRSLPPVQQAVYEEEDLIPRKIRESGVIEAEIVPPDPEEADPPVDPQPSPEPVAPKSEQAEAGEGGDINIDDPIPLPPDDLKDTEPKLYAVWNMTVAKCAVFKITTFAHFQIFATEALGLSDQLAHPSRLELDQWEQLLKSAGGGK